MVAPHEQPGDRSGGYRSSAWQRDLLRRHDQVAQDRGLTATEAAQLAAVAVAVPGADVATPLVGVCPAGSRTPRLDPVWTAADLLTAWP
jgi:hypothetical protein